ncbi:selenocysteine-specific elongation factor [Motilibacter rhizosphaerae]|uniref:Selenocysteine-specific elongation factor n=1 Tax=Motilibacter rhizosphaerae TaxID=598652 RepID=A0A4Q7NUZ3_9ACTN|nr:selenocysteine-specific translation elongation factor [Motilibacter rhizosphaerae]RZS90965.1 selenocysteine-specific elongation factor [Motilibacter rhizosphaerae]
MHVVATAGHVDHGKSTLVRALTGMEPDRWAEERRRGMTIDLGYAWTRLPSGETISFVDVPGHARFLGNMLAGIGPAPAVLVVVAADEGWRQQSTEHLAAVEALRLRHGLLAVTRSDLADPGPATEEALRRIASSSLGQVPAVQVSGATGAGLDELRSALDALVARLPAPDPAAAVRLWVDRAFTVRGAGTVVTGTLAAGTLRVDDVLSLRGRDVRVRGLQSLGEPHEHVTATARVAVNLRGVELDEVGRGDALLSPGSWRPSALVDVRLDPGDRLPAELTLHAGTAAVPTRVRPLDGDVARLSLAHPLPLAVGERLLLRDPGDGRIVGLSVLDTAPERLRRRGDARRRAEALRQGPEQPQDVLERRGFVPAGSLAADGVEAGGWLVARSRWAQWQEALRAACLEHQRAEPLSPGLPEGAAAAALGLPDPEVVAPLAAATGLERGSGRVRTAGWRPSLGAAEEAVRRIEDRLRNSAFDAPDLDELRSAGLGPRELAAAATAGRLLRLPGEVLLLPDGPARAMRVLAGLPQPFTVSQARTALGSSRRVVVPLLEHLDGRGWTKRAPDSSRTVRRP